MQSDFAKIMQAYVFLGKLLGITLFSLCVDQNLWTSVLPHMPFWIVSIGLHIFGFLAIVRIPDMSKYTKLGLLAIFGQTAAYFFIRLPYYIYRRTAFRKAILQIDEVNSRLGIPGEQCKADLIRISIATIVFCSMALCEPVWTEIEMVAKFSYFLGTGVMLYEECLMDKLLRQIYGQLKTVNSKLQSRPSFLSMEKVLPTKKSCNSGKLTELRDLERDQYLNEVFKLSDVHLKLCRVIKSVNGVFDLSCIVLAAMAFTVFTYNLYDLSFGILKCVLYGPECCQKLKSFVDVCLMSLIMLRLTNVINNWSKIQVEARKTVLLLHKSWNDLVLFDKIDLKTKHIILLTVQLNDAQTKITAYGFFEISWPLLLTIIGGAATYVIILIQFRIAINDLL